MNPKTKIRVVQALFYLAFAALLSTQFQGCNMMDSHTDNLKQTPHKRVLDSADSLRVKIDRIDRKIDQVLANQ